jgi:hypothetical protein
MEKYKKRKKEREFEEADVSRYWMILTEIENTVHSNKKIHTALCGEVDLAESTDLSQNRLRTST